MDTPLLPATRLYDALFFVALLSAGIALGAAHAHLLELPNKIAMPRDAYLATQQAYRGWALLGWLLLVEIASILATAFLSRRAPAVLWPLLAAAAFLVAAQAVFWTFTWPANVATANWTRLPDGWESLRARWEYSHALGAIFQLLVSASLFTAVLRARHL
jgi:hypothetical protein